MPPRQLPPPRAPISRPAQSPPRRPARLTVRPTHRQVEDPHRTAEPGQAARPGAATASRQEAPGSRGRESMTETLTRARRAPPPHPRQARRADLHPRRRWRQGHRVRPQARLPLGQWSGAHGVPSGAAECVHPLECRSQHFVLPPHRDGDTQRLQAGTQCLSFKPPQPMGESIGAGRPRRGMWQRRDLDDREVRASPAEVGDQADRSLVEQRGHGEDQCCRREHPPRDTLDRPPRIAERDLARKQGIDDPVKPKLSRTLARANAGCPRSRPARPDHGAQDDPSPARRPRGPPHRASHSRHLALRQTCRAEGRRRSNSPGDARSRIGPHVAPSPASSPAVPGRLPRMDEYRRIRCPRPSLALRANPETAVCVPARRVRASAVRGEMRAASHCARAGPTTSLSQADPAPARRRGQRCVHPSDGERHPDKLDRATGRQAHRDRASRVERQLGGSHQRELHLDGGRA